MTPGKNDPTVQGHEDQKRGVLDTLASIGMFLVCGAIAIAPGGVVVIGLYLFLRNRDPKRGASGRPR